MLDFVIDTNVIMSMLVSGKSQYRTILSFYNFYLPEYALLELADYQEIIKEKTKFSEQELSDFIYFVFSTVSVIPNFALSRNSILQASKLCEKVDIKDTAFVALAIDMNIPLLTRDEKLQKHLIKQGFRPVILFDDFLRRF